MYLFVILFLKVKTFLFIAWMTFLRTCPELIHGLSIKSINKGMGKYLNLYVFNSEFQFHPEYLVQQVRMSVLSSTPLSPLYVMYSLIPPLKLPGTRMDKLCIQEEGILLCQVLYVHIVKDGDCRIQIRLCCKGCICRNEHTRHHCLLQMQHQNLLDHSGDQKW